VRVNAWDSPYTLRDLVEVVAKAGARLDTVMLPKVQRAEEVVALDLLLTQIERESGLRAGQLGIEAQIETARGMLAVDAICAASPRLESVILGPGDLAASMEMPVLTGGVQIPEYPGDHFHYVFTRILLAGRAAGVQVIDGPYFRIRDLDGLRDYTQRVRVLGYDGKWALHPDQIPVINEMFSPTQEQFDHACRLLDSYARSTDTDGRGAVLFDGEMIDEASRKMATKFVVRGERAGLRRP
jgi:citrate lyase subunit beta/citryl-CoA lyase